MTVENWETTRRTGPRTVTTTRDPYHKLTLDDIKRAIASVADTPPDPLNGATILWVHPDDKQAIELAGKLRVASGGVLHVREHIHAFPDRIHGFRGADFLPCVVINLKEKSDADCVS